MNQPPFDRSLLDGYALIAKDTINASKENPKILKVVDEVFQEDIQIENLKKMRL
ncbi:MAG: hypothetical protein ACLTDP_09245 [Terrisporobacter sp.]